MQAPGFLLDRFVYLILERRIAEIQACPWPEPSLTYSQSPSNKPRPVVFQEPTNQLSPDANLPCVCLERCEASPAILHHLCTSNQRLSVNKML